MSNYNAERVLEMFEKVIKLVDTQSPHDRVISISEQLNLLQTIKDNPKNSNIINFTHPRAPLDTLIALCEEGPLYDGDIPSKSERDTLVELGYAARISVGGEQGFNAATYKGNNAYTNYFNAHSIIEAKANRLLRKTLKKASSKNE